MRKNRPYVTIIVAVAVVVWMCGCASSTATRRYVSLVEQSRLRERCIDLLLASAASENPLLRANAIEGLSNAPTRIEPVIRSGLVDENAAVRFVATMSAGRLRLRSMSRRLWQLRNDSDPRVQAAALFALVQVGESVDLSPLAQFLAHPNPQVRAEAARVLGELGNPSASAMLKAAAARPAPTSAKSDGTSRIAEQLFQLQVAEALVKLGHRGESDAIRAALYPPAREGFEAATLAAQILGAVHDERAIGQLVDLIEQRVPGTGESDDPRRDQFLQPPELRLATARSLAQMGYPGGLYVGQTYAHEPNPVLRSQAAFVLSQAGGQPQIAELAEMLDDPSPIVQVAAAASILELLDRLAAGPEVSG